MDAAVHSLDHFALCVPDVDAGGEFYADFGLRPAAAGGALQLETPSGVAGFLYEGGPKRLHHLTFGIDARDAAELKGRLERGGIRLVDAPRERESDGLWFRDVDGNLIELAAAPRRSPARTSPLRTRSAGEGERGAPEGSERVEPRRLGHTLLFSPDPLRAVAFYERFLGLRLSDRSGDVVAFMHSPHGGDHHILAFGKSDRPGFHHASFELADIDEIGIGAMRMRARGYTQGWGFGRHYIGSNYFYYVRDPWGSFAEYFCDIDYIPAGCTWRDRDVPAERALYVWGPPPPPYFFENAEASSLVSRGP
jgi:catechol 2,3-dioxygenase-like lactoylglutathione lyase family enzyme